MFQYVSMMCAYVDIHMYMYICLCMLTLQGNLIEFGIIFNIPIEGVHSYGLTSVESCIRTLLLSRGAGEVLKYSVPYLARSY